MAKPTPGGAIVKESKAATRPAPPVHFLEVDMGIAASELCQHVIRPTLIYLGRHCAAAEALLLGAAACQSGLGT
ncbi:MAG TPA: hypothetical protein DIU04_10990, partial [Pseudomonas sp.]|nr:hypothetical protein [Pseudomonas sp.]